MGKALGWLVAILLLVAALAFGARWYAARVMAERALTPKEMGGTTPAAAGLSFSRLLIPNGNRTLVAWWVRAPADSGENAPALLFLHGNRSAISDYVPLQRFLHRQGISSFVFDYSGFGASGGTASLRNAVSDAGRVARVFADSAGITTRKVAMGSALGATVLLQAIDSVQPHVNGLVIEGVDASVREAAVRAGHVPEFIAPAVVDIGNNVAAASKVRIPLLAIHSYDDNRVPIDDARRVVDAVPGPAALVRHWRKGHSAILASSRPCDWAPVLDFVKTRALPKMKFDTTDACAAAAARGSDTTATAPAASAVTGTPTGVGDSAAVSPESTGTAKTADSTKAKAPDTTKTQAPSAKTKAPALQNTKTKTGTKRP